MSAHGTTPQRSPNPAADGEPGLGSGRVVAPAPCRTLAMSAQARVAVRAEVAAYRRDLIAVARQRARRRRCDVVSAVDVETAADALGDCGARAWTAHGAGLLVGGGIGAAVAVVQMDQPPLR